MGNRAVITTRKDLKDIGVYLHWNGGRDSVEGFLTYCKIKGYRPPEYDNYGWAYLCMTIGNFFGGEGFFNTVVTGPGKVLLQTMPINAVAGSIAPYIPSGGKN